MINYDYECLDCNSHFQIKLTMADKEKNMKGEKEVHCTECKSAKTRSRITGVHDTITWIFSK